MKWLFVLLLAVNGAYFAWEAYYAPSTPPKRAEKPVVKPPGNPLVLLSEVKGPLPAPEPVEAPAPEPAAPKSDRLAAPAVDEPKPPAPTFVCYRIEGIASKTDADVLTAALQQRGARLIGRGANQASRRSYWVMLPPFSSRPAAQKAVAELQKRGLSDFYLVRSGEYENAISLGVFSTEASAKRRLEQIRGLSLAYRPQLDFIELAAQRYWVAVRWADGEEPPDWRELVPADPEVSINSAACGSPR